MRNWTDVVVYDPTGRIGVLWTAGRWTLPRLTFAPTTRVVAQIAGGKAARHADACVLEHDFRVYDAQAQALVWTTLVLSRRAWRGLALVDPEELAATRAVLPTQAHLPAEIRPPLSPTWYDSHDQWCRAAASQAGVQLYAGRQLRVDRSRVVVQYSSGVGDVFYKASRHGGPSPMTLALYRCMPEALPPLIAMSEIGDRVLVGAASGQSVSGAFITGDLPLVIRSLADIHVRSLEVFGRATNLPILNAHVLTDSVISLVDAAHLVVGRHCTPSEVQEWVRLIRVTSRCLEGDAPLVWCDIDCASDNLFLDGDALCFIDTEESQLAAPWVGLAALVMAAWPPDAQSSNELLRRAATLYETAWREAGGGVVSVTAGRLASTCALVRALRHIRGLMSMAASDELRPLILQRVRALVAALGESAQPS
jgi:hypothetical protein